MTAQLVRDLENRVRALERDLSGMRQIIGVSTAAEQTVVPVIAVTPVIVGAETSWTITFLSAPGEQFEVQTSNDLITWTTLESPLPAAAAPAETTSWTSAGYTIDQTPIWFRVRKFPPVLTNCTAGAATCV